ncbi:hypothetical protein EPUS_04686 [Endocarpon pusillum Z07020]|uniref:Amino acid permease/ SLC12A domain-containing protein n=1 Tax=Endocarpon pusillum (strain Z07020 / HMAS-L-300199) TaxID=1263415 RepID=U1G9C1_ENDPU|nr:uncharacterized protein EPUS_04686 [Endocarpon pusillum Z07020]ERF68588.1 hypothetical protein EPUS_04686 [Endocarpon pusillum Z07020]
MSIVESNSKGFNSPFEVRSYQGGSDHQSIDSRSTTNHNGTRSHLARRLFDNDRLDRKLKRHHITSIAFSGTIGIGLFVTSGQIISISGSGGCVISFVVAGLIVIAVMRTLAEMVSVRPLSGALIDFPHTFVDPALGFAVGIMYCLAQCLSMAALTSAAARIADNFLPDGRTLANEQKAGIITGLLIITLLSNACGVQLYGRLERVVKWLKYFIIIGVCVLMIIINVGVGGKSFGTTNYTQHAMAPSLRWAGFNSTADAEEKSSEFGIQGHTGRFLGVWTSTTLAIFACMGGDLVIVTAGEAEAPRRDLAPSARFMYLVPISCYIFGSFLVGFNINFMDAKLFHPFASWNYTTSHSPFIIAVGYTSIRVLPALLKACFLFSAYTAANTGLFASSRTLFAIAQLYGNDFIKRTIGTTNSGHTPIAAIICCSSFGLLAFLGLADGTYNQPILSLSSFFVSTLACVYISECIAFLRFKKGLTTLDEKDVFSRDEELYRKRHYRAHWQPLCAIFGLAGCLLVVMFSGWPAIYLLKNYDAVKPDQSIKPQLMLIGDLLGAYLGPLLFLSLFIIYKFVYGTEFRSLSDFEDAYFLPNFDQEPLAKRPHGFKAWIKEIWSFVK